MRLEELELYKQCIIFEEKIWNVVSQWDYFSKDAMGKQLVRSADSISSNIAEGYGRYFYKENRQFCYYSRGSLLETKNWIIKAHQRKLISEKEFTDFQAELEIIHRKLNAYIKSIGTRMAVGEKQE